jgi:hypothetical protein
MPSFDYLDDAREALRKSEMPHVLLCGVQENDGRCYRQSSIGDLASLDWFRRRFEEWHTEMKEILEREQDR